MIKGIFVPAPQPAKAQTLPFGADLVPIVGHPSAREVKAVNFVPDPLMRASLRTAKQACEHRLATFSSVWEAILFPFLARPLARFWLILAGIGFLGCVAFSLGAMIWAFVPFNPPSLLLPSKRAFALSSLIVFGATILSLPWRVFPDLRSLLSGWRSLEGLQSSLKGTRFEAYVGDRNKQYGHFFGPSAGLTFFCAFVEAVAESGHQKIRLPWQKHLLKEMDRWVTSVALGPEERFDPIGNSPDFTHKLKAIWAYNQQRQQNGLTLAVFSLEDQSRVEQEWSRIVGEDLKLRLGASKGCRTAESTQARLIFLFCRNLKDFLHFLHPWDWRWAVFRIGAVLAILILAPIIPEPTRPEFTIECTPACALIRPGLHYAAMCPDEMASVHIKIGSPGFPGLLDLNVESNYEETLSPTRAEKARKQFSLTVVQEKLFFFTMPHDPQGEVVVVITVLNRVGKWSQATIFFAPRGACAEPP